MVIESSNTRPMHVLMTVPEPARYLSLTSRSGYWVEYSLQPPSPTTRKAITSCPVLQYQMLYIDIAFALL